MIKNYLQFLVENIQTSGTTGQTQIDEPEVQPPAKRVSEKEEEKLDKYNDMIEYTYLKEDINLDKIKELCQIAQEKGYYSICILPHYVSEAYAFLEEDEIKISTVVNHPSGENKSEKNIKEALEVISEGAEIINFVIDYKVLKEAKVLENILSSNIKKNELSKEEIKDEQDTIQSMYDKIELKITDVAEICTKNGVVLRVIIEAGELTTDEIKKACELCDVGGAECIMTSTGNMKGVDLSKVKYIREILPEHIKIILSGGIRNISQVEEYYDYIDLIATSTVLK
jgi:deoxyribose-phosphate aldolase